MSGKKLYKSDTNRMICGVCGGVGEYFNIDPTIVRLLFVFSGLRPLPELSPILSRRSLFRPDLTAAIIKGSRSPFRKERTAA